MEQFLLVVFFLVNGQWVSHPEFMPLRVESMEVCEERMTRAQNYFDSVEGIPQADVNCYRQVGEVF